MFKEKGFSKEQTDLFLKKVNFMENREYFFHKRKAMVTKEDGTEEENFEPVSDQYQAYNQSKKLLQEKRNQAQNYSKKKPEFFDKISSSCVDKRSKSSHQKAVRFRA